MQVIKKNLSVLIPFLGLILVIALIGIASKEAFSARQSEQHS